MNHMELGVVEKEPKRELHSNDIDNMHGEEDWKNIGPASQTQGCLLYTLLIFHDFSINLFHIKFYKKNTVSANQIVYFSS